MPQSETLFRFARCSDLSSFSFRSLIRRLWHSFRVQKILWEKDFKSKPTLRPRLSFRTQEKCAYETQFFPPVGGGGHPYETDRDARRLA